MALVDCARELVDADGDALLDEAGQVVLLVHVDGHADHGDAVVDGLEEAVVAHVRHEEDRLGVRQDRLLR